MKRLFLMMVLPLLFLIPGATQKTINIADFGAPAGDRTATNDPAAPVLPNGRLLTPRGKQVRIAAHPYGLALSPDGRTIVASCNGTEPFALSIIDEWQSAAPKLHQITADRERYKGSKTADEDDAEFRSAFMGVAVGPDNRTLYASSGNQGSVFIFDLADRKRLATISINDSGYRNSFSGALALAKDGGRIFVLDQANYRIAVIDTAKRRVIESLATGRAPFSIALSPDERKLYVTNAGVFRYSLIEGYDPKDPKRTGVSFPPFAYLSEEMKRGVTFEGKRAPGLGDPNDDEAASIWSYEIDSGGKLKVAAKSKTGRLIGETANGISVIGASSPSGVVAGSRHVFVSNANNDSVTVLDSSSNKVIANVDLNLFNFAIAQWRKQGLRVTSEQAENLSRLRGQIPFGLALSRDERRLYVTEAGINALAVIDARNFKLLGHIPTAWFPSQISVSADGKNLFIANAKGFGSGPNGGPNFKAGPEGSYVGALQKGVVSIVPVPGDSQLVNETQQVLKNNGIILNSSSRQESIIPGKYGAPSDQIKYVVFITKENRTYDQVYGDVEKDKSGRRLRSFAGLATYGSKSNVFDKNNRVALRDVNVTPNHHALAQQFAFSDNFYLDSDVSADGHRWLVGVYPNAWVETSLAASYGGHRDFRPVSSSPGRLTFTGSSSSIHPEDYLESGSVWEHLNRFRISFRNYGEGFELGGIEEEADYEPTGARFPVNYPMPQPLYQNTARDFPTFNMNISDQYRLQQFEKDFRSKFIDGRQEMPRFTNIYLPNDHTSKERPEDGYPYRASFVADNDYALGRVVELLTNSPYWKQMVIFVTEDDAQDGRDSIDAHRSLLLVISPYAKRGYAMSSHTSIASIFKTTYLLLGLQPLNQYDAGAMDLREAFTTKPDFTAYKTLDVDPRIFDVKKVRMISRSRTGDAERLDDPADFERSHRRLEKQQEK
ncbi:MAG: hypothetical protein IPJ07_05255 [Acidobacteria bacterium]|nr:hypothetical protein [Acidobacteriota bacterium]